MKNPFATNSDSGIRQSASRPYFAWVMGLATVICLAMIAIWVYDPGNSASEFNSDPEVDHAPSKASDDLFGSYQERNEFNGQVATSEALFRSIVPLLREAREQRHGAANKAKSSINEALLEIASAVDADSFSRAMIGWESTYNNFGGSGSMEKWVSERFSQEVLDVNADGPILDVYAETLEREIGEVNQQILELVVPGATYRQNGYRVDLPSIQYCLDATVTELVNKSMATAYYAPLETIGTTAVSTLVGALAEQWASGSSNSKKTNSNFGTGIGWAAGLAVDYAGQDVFGSASELERCIEVSLASCFDRICHQGADKEEWTKTIDDYVAICQEVVESGIAHAIGVSPDWANLQLQ